MTQPLQRTHVLRVFVSGHCPLTDQAALVADAIRRQFPAVLVEVVDVDTTLEPVPDVLFSVPTYILNGRVVSLGNPDAQFIRRLRALFGREATGKIQR